MIRIGFCIERKNAYRTLGPLILAASVDPELEVFQILGPVVQSEKSYLNPTPENIPPLLRVGQVLPSVDRTDFLKHLKSMQVVVNLVGREGYLTEVSEGPLWCVVEDADHSTHPSHRFDDADLAFWSSEAQLQRALAYDENDFFVKRIHALGVDRAAGLRRNARCLGWIRADGLAQTTREGTRKEWGLPLDKPVVLYIPDAFRLLRDVKMGPQGVTISMFRSWYQQIWCRGSIWSRIKHCKKHQTWKWPFDLLSRDVSEDAMLQSLRDFCNRAGAKLVFAKRRQKTVVDGCECTPMERQVCDYFIQEDVDFPQSTLKACQMADLVVCGYVSGTFMDAAAAEVAYLTIRMPEDAYTAEAWKYIREHRPREIYDTYGATWSVDARKATQFFKNKNLSDIVWSPREGKSFREKYVGVSRGEASQAVLQKIKKTIAERRVSS